MNFLKYILLFIFSLLLNRNVSATEIIVVENENVFFEVSHNQTISEEYTWLGLLYLQENSKLVASNDKASLSCRQSFLSVNRDLIDAWEVLVDVGVDELIRKNADVLDDIDAIEDALSEVPASPKPTWPEIMVRFKRGNDFNKKGRVKYTDDFVEIVLKGVDGKAGKRLDTYLPPSNGQIGQIISRKATTLSEIQPNTFKSYLNELITKYTKGADLNSSKFPSGTILDGDYFLEIPMSNQSFFNSSIEFQKVLTDFNTAKDVIVEVIYLVE